MMPFGLTSLSFVEMKRPALCIEFAGHYTGLVGNQRLQHTIISGGLLMTERFLLRQISICDLNREWVDVKVSELRSTRQGCNCMDAITKDK